MQGPPFPYLQEHADSWVDSHKEICDAVLRELEEESKTHPDGPLKFVEACPVRSIREVKADGTELFLGDIGIDRYGYEGLQGEKKARLVDENMAKKTGDPTIIWSVGGNQHEVKELRAG